VGLLLVELTGGLVAPGPPIRPALAGVAATLLLLSARLAGSSPAGLRLVGTTGLAALTGAAAPGLIEHPGLFFGLAAGIGYLLLRLWSPEGSAADAVPLDRAGDRQAAARAASRMAVVIWFVTLPTGISRSALADGLVAVTILLAVGQVLAYLAVERRTRPFRRRWLLVALGGCLLGAALAWTRWRVGVSLGALFLLLATPWLSSGPRGEGGLGSGIWEAVLDHPARLLVVSFVFICMTGGVLLSLPLSGVGGVPVAPIDGFFQSVSATCVTGLATVDVGKVHSRFGQVVLVLLIQVGGLGIMTFSTAAAALLGRRLSLRHEGAVANLLGEQGRGELFRATRTILVVTFGAEAVGALVLSGHFLALGDGAGMAVWRGVFHAVSAFCNAGFGLQTDNLVIYQKHPVILHTIGLLILLGGLGPAVVVSLPALLRGRPVAVQTRLAVLITVALLGVAFVAVAVLEWTRTLGALSVADRLHNAWFQAVTPRTAGFNSVDIAALKPATYVLMLLLMFIGGCPGSTAGGVKTTTFGLLLLTMLASLRGEQQATWRGRQIAHASIYRAGAIVTLGAFTVILGVFALLLTQELSLRKAVFEVVSAFGTVGLSVGATAELDSVGKVIVMIIMFLGRVGPLSLFLLLSDEDRRPLWRYPEEEVAVG
jgi:trk system potassium uptake protein TrkH